MFIQTRNVGDSKNMKIAQEDIYKRLAGTLCMTFDTAFNNFKHFSEICTFIKAYPIAVKLSWKRQTTHPANF